MAVTFQSFVQELPVVRPGAAVPDYTNTGGVPKRTLFGNGILMGRLEPDGPNRTVVHSTKYTSSTQISVFRGGPALGAMFLWACQLMP